MRDVCPTRTADQARKRRQGKSDALDSERIARETATHADLPPAFKRARSDSGVDENHDLMALWHTTRRSLAKVRAQLLNEAAALLHQLPEDVRDGLGGSQLVQPQLNALAKRLPELRRRRWDAATALRLRLLAEHIKMIAELRKRDAEAAQELRNLLEARGSTLTELPGLAERSAAELLVEVGDARRFTSGGFARFNGTAPLPASSGEGGDQPVRHRYNPAGNRRVNAALHRMAITQLRCEPRARQLYNNARKAGHTKRKKRCASSNATSATWSTGRCCETSRRRPHRLDIGASNESDAASATSTTTATAAAAPAAASTGTLAPLRASEAEVLKWQPRAA